MEFANGDAVSRSSSPARRRSKTASQARTEVTFLPSRHLHHVEFDYATIEHRLRELAFLNSGVHIVLTDARHAEIKQDDLYYEGGWKPSCASSTASRLRCCPRRSW